MLILHLCIAICLSIVLQSLHYGIGIHAWILLNMSLCINIFYLLYPQFLLQNMTKRFLTKIHKLLQMTELNLRNSEKYRTRGENAG